MKWPKQNREGGRLTRHSCPQCHSAGSSRPPPATKVLDHPCSDPATVCLLIPIKQERQSARETERHKERVEREKKSLTADHMFSLSLSAEKHDKNNGGESVPKTDDANFESKQSSQNKGKMSTNNIFTTTTYWPRYQTPVAWTAFWTHGRNEQCKELPTSYELLQENKPFPREIKPPQTTFTNFRTVNTTPANHHKKTMRGAKKVSVKQLGVLLYMFVIVIISCC